MGKKIYTILNSTSAKVMLLIIVLVLPLNVIAIIAVNSTLDTVVEQVRLMEQDRANSYMADISTRMDNTLSLLHYLASKNSDFIKMNMQKENNYDYQSAKLKSYYHLKAMAGMIDGGDGFYYFNKYIDDIIIYSDQKKDNSTIEDLTEFMTEYAKKENPTGWHFYEWNARQYLILYVETKDIAYGGWLDLDIYKEQMIQDLVYANFTVNFTEGNEITADESEIGMYARKKNIFLSISISKKDILKDISGYQRFLQTTAFVYLILVPVLYIVLRYLLLKPLHKINFAHKEIQNGNQDYRIIEKDGSAEYKEIYESFNQMVDNLHNLKIEAYETEISRQKMELRNLQLQIRPHFLLNIFNLILTMAERKQTEAIEEIVIYLSEYFRYIFRSNKELELFSKELHLLEGYARMMDIRYPGQVEISFHIAPEILFIRIPPLLLLNFVENAVKHGVKKGKMLHILVMAEYADGKVVFDITDDGNGMDKDTLKRNRSIIEGESEPDNVNTHVGLYNSLKRLKYFYGDEAELYISSEQGQMTCFIIRFPYQLEVDDESFDCK